MGWCSRLAPLVCWRTRSEEFRTRWAAHNVHLFPAQSGNPPTASVGGQPGLLGSDAGTAGSQELADLGAVGHTPDGRKADGQAGRLCQYMVRQYLER